MYKDIISYQLAKNCSKEELFEIAQKVFTDWMKNQPGFIKWEIHENKKGGYTDLVYWQDEKSAKTAEKAMANMPHAIEWFNCYDPKTITSFSLIEKNSFVA